MSQRSISASCLSRFGLRFVFSLSHRPTRDSLPHAPLCHHQAVFARNLRALRIVETLAHVSPPSDQPLVARDGISPPLTDGLQPPADYFETRCLHAQFKQRRCDIA
uniref:Uncharacterized protein n=1 Tax=Chrysotila carterae TaxID=13221 RepID=A0A7S4B9M7_CHRCT